jgi:ketosteroid isomerase-like protein
MKTWIGLLLAAVMVASASGAKQDPAAQVRAAETAFARSMADRSLAAFETYVSEEAVFFGRSGVMRGRAAVVAGWKPLFEGPTPLFSWEPDQVEVLDSGDLALSTGPVRDPEGKQIGTFQSIWRRESKGKWTVVFDKGCPVCETAEKP